MFKSNSRFSALADEVKEKKKDNKKRDEQDKEKDKVKNEDNSFKSDRNSFKQSYDDRNKRNYITNNYSKQQLDRRANEERLKKEEDDKNELKRREVALAPESFPELITTKKTDSKEKSNNYVNFSEMVKTKIVEKKCEEEDNEDIDFKNLKPGWALIKKDRSTGKIITRYKESLDPPREKTEKECALDVLNALVKLHERQKAEYIHLWGYDAWEQMYIDPNYDYGYFDRLDELYEEEMDNSSSENEDNSEYATEQDNYWKY
jgi:hypothetical protein